MKLITNWTSFYKMWTVQLATILSILTVAETYFPAAQALLPEAWQAYVGAAIIVVRVLKQKLSQVDEVLQPPAK